MLQDLTDGDLAITTEMIIHHGMYRYGKFSKRFKMYQEVADKLLDEMQRRNLKEDWIKPLLIEYTLAQIKYVPEYEEKDGVFKQC